LLTCSEPLLKAYHHEFKAFREWILTSLEETETPYPTHPMAVALLAKFIHVFPKEIPPGLPLSVLFNTTSISFLEPSYPINRPIG